MRCYTSNSVRLITDQGSQVGSFQSIHRSSLSPASPLDRENLVVPGDNKKRSFVIRFERSKNSVVSDQRSKISQMETVVDAWISSESPVPLATRFSQYWREIQAQKSGFDGADETCLCVEARGGAAHWVGIGV